METLEKSLQSSEKTIVALILQTYSVLNEQFKMVESRTKITQDYHNLISQYCKEQSGVLDGVDRNKNGKLVKVNVGGKVHIIQRSTILSEEDHVNFLYLMISGRWDYLLPSRDCNGVIFIDLDPALITPIFDKIRFRSNYGNTEQMVPRISMDKRANFYKAVSYYRMGEIVDGNSTLSEYSMIKCMNDPKNIFLLNSFLPSGFTEMQLRFELLYRGSRDGMMAVDFHRLCDSKNDTICVIKDTNGNVFGGFADKAWSSQSSWVESERSFLFSLKSSMGNHVLKFPVDKGNPHSLNHDPNLMCSFGKGDLYVVPFSGQSSSSIQIGKSYQNPSSEFSHYYCTGGCKKFTPQEIEVYQIIQQGSRASDKFHSDDLPIIPRSLTRKEQLSLEAVTEPTAVSSAYTTQTNNLSLDLLHMAKVAQMAEEKLLLELMWIEHLSVPMSKRNLSAGLLAEWQRTCEESADVLPLTNGVVVTSNGSETLKRIEESMDRLQIKVEPKMEGDSSEGSAKSSAINNESKSVINEKANTATDDVISFNLGGTIIAVLRSTLLLQAPNSTFAAKYSDRWVQQPDELDECGNIYMVKEIMVIAFTLFLLHFLLFVPLCFFSVNNISSLDLSVSHLFVASSSK